MQTIEAFLQEVNDIAAFRTTHAQKRCVFVSEGHIDDALAVHAVSVQIVDDLPL